MQPEYLILRSQKFLESFAAIQFGNLARPSVAYLDSRNQTLAYSKLFRDSLLRFTRLDPFQNSFVACIKLVHTILHPGNYIQGVIGSFGLHRQERFNDGQERSAIIRVRASKGIKLFPLRVAPPVRMNTAKAKPVLKSLQYGEKNIGYPNSYRAFRWMNFNRTFSIQKARKVGRKSFLAPMFHITDDAVLLAGWRYLFSMAVPVLKWIGQRIELVNELT